MRGRQVKVTWDEPYDGNSPVTGYDVIYKRASGELDGVKGPLSDPTRSIVVIGVKIFKTENVVKYEVRNMPASLLKQHCYCPMLLMRTTKTAGCLQTKAIFHHLYGF